MRRRGEVVGYVRRKYGEQCVANIITYNTFGAKGVIRDVARVNNLPYADADRLAKMIPAELNITLEVAAAKSAELRAELAGNPAAKRIFDQALVLEGMVRNSGKHASAVIITDQPLQEFVPLTLQEGDVTVQFDMNAAGKIGLLKMDFLGLKTLTVIADAVDNIRRGADPAFDIEKIPFDDPRTFALFNSGRTVGVFQFESSGIQNLCRQLQVSSIEEVSAVSALYRPGPMDWIPDYVRGKKDPSTVTFPHPLLEDICRGDLRGHGLSGAGHGGGQGRRRLHSRGRRYSIRRAMGKKDVDATQAGPRAHQVREPKRAAAARTSTKKLSNTIFEHSSTNSRAMGSTSPHSAAYSVLSYQTAYLEKANHPTEFMAAVLTSEIGNSTRTTSPPASSRSAKAMGLRVLRGPDRQ